MEIRPDSKLYEGSWANCNMFGTVLPQEFSGARSEYLACRETAWIGTALCCSPVYDVGGADATEFLQSVCTNNNFGTMKPGQSKHALMLSERGYLIADGMCMYKGEGVWRTYWLAPVLQYYVMTSGLDVEGEYRADEYFIQIDGPKSLEIVETATGADLHDIKFARNKTVQIEGTPVVVHRLGMSGCLAYELYGSSEDFEVAYAKLREVTEAFGGKPQGFRNYVVMNHTPAGYPNQFQHFGYDLYEGGDAGLAEFAKRACPPQHAGGPLRGRDDAIHVTPYDIGWGYLINTKHEFRGKKAVLALKQNARTAVTLEWNADDVAEVFKSQFLGTAVAPYKPIEPYHDFYNGGALPGIDAYTVHAGGREIGYAAGRTYAFYEQRMISLAFIDPAHAVEGEEVVVAWGDSGYPTKEIRATVAAFPYYDGELRNETCDVEALIPHVNA